MDLATWLNAVLYDEASTLLATRELFTRATSASSATTPRLAMSVVDLEGKIDEALLLIYSFMGSTSKDGEETHTDVVKVGGAMSAGAALGGLGAGLTLLLCPHLTIGERGVHILLIM